LSLAALVTRTAADSLANLKSVSATETTTTHASQFKDYSNVDAHETIEYRVAQDGSYWESAAGTAGNRLGTTTTSYSPASGKYTMCDTYPPAVNPPRCNTNWGPALANTRLFTFISAVENARQGQNETASEITYANAKAWSLEYDTNPIMAAEQEHVKLVVDQATGLPVQLETTVNGKPDSEASLANLQVNPAFDNSQMHVVIPTGATLVDSTKPGSQGIANGVTTYGTGVTGSPKGALPTTTADGFTTKEIWTSDHSADNANGACKTNPDQHVATHIDQTSRRGLLAYSVTSMDLSTCSAPDIRDLMTDFDHSIKTKTVVAAGGVMKGTEFDIYLQPDHSFFIYGKNNAIASYAQGNLTLADIDSLINGYAK
jgi:outer membrane lipoprotein-sorting protein